MNPSDSQGELLPQPPTPGREPSLAELQDFFAKEALRNAEEIGELKRQLQAQRAVFVGAVIALLVLSGSVNLITAKQMRMARDQLNAVRPRVLRLYTDFRAQGEPTVTNFVGQLQAFAETNRDFQPVLERYRPYLQKYFTGPAAQPPVLPAVQPPVPPPKKAAK